MKDNGWKMTGATDALVNATREKDSARRAEWHRIAQISAMERLADAIFELNSTIKERRQR